MIEPTVTGYGSLQPKVMVVGGYPTANELISGKPFTNDEGVMVHELMRVHGLSLTNTYMTYAIKTKLRNRPQITLGKDMIVLRERLIAEWRDVNSPRYIISVGEIAFAFIVPRLDFTLDILGKPLRLNSAIVLPTLNPRLGHENPEMQDLIESHWSKVKNWRI